MPQAEYNSKLLGMSGLILSSALTESSGTAFAESISGNTLNAASAPSRVLGPDGVSLAPNFAATANRILIPTSAVVMPTTHTVVYWIKLNSQGAADAMAFEWAATAFAKYAQHDIGYPGTIAGLTGRMLFSVYYGAVTGAAAEYANRAILVNGVWTFVCLTMDVAFVSLNEHRLLFGESRVGLQAGLTSYHQSGVAGSGILGIGGRGQGGRTLPLDGAMQGVGIFNRRVTRKELEDLQDAMIPFTSGSRRLVEAADDPDGMTHNAFPGLVLGSDGTTAISAYHHAVNHTSSTNKIRVRRLGLDGHQIGTVDIHTSSGGVSNVDVSCIKLASGVIRVYWNGTSTPGLSNINTVTTLNHKDSSDNGATFGSITTESMPGFPSNGAGVAGAYGIAPSPPIQIPVGLPNAGRLYLPVYGYDNKVVSSWTQNEYVKVMYSDDNGVTWALHSTPFPVLLNFAYDEPALILLPGGNILIAVRTIENDGSFSIWTAKMIAQSGVWTNKTRAFGTGSGTSGYGGRPTLCRLPNGTLRIDVRRMNASISGHPSYYTSNNDGASWSSGKDPYDLAAERTVTPVAPRGLMVYNAAYVISTNEVMVIWAEESPTTDTEATIYFRVFTHGEAVVNHESVKIDGVFVPCATKVKIADVFVSKPEKVKIGGSFV